MTGGLQTIDGFTTDYGFGHTVAGVGDVDGDGFEDLLVGAYSGGTNSSGEVFLYRGSSTGLVTNAWWSFRCPVPASEFGHQVEGVGDVNGDGFPDFVVGATYYSVPGKPAQTGGAFVFLGGTSGPRLAPGWPVAGEIADSKTGFTVAAAGDVNGDGYDDILVGAWTNPKEPSVPGAPPVGRVFLFAGGPDGPSTNALWSPSGEKVQSAFGYSVHGAGDVNGDGYADVVVGSYGYESSFKGCGRVYVFYGSPSGPGDSPDWTLTGSQGGQMTGNSVFTAGDVNGDGYDDLIVAANGTSDQVSYEGVVLAFYGGPQGLASRISWWFESHERSMFVGHSVATAGDVNHDGYSDVVFSAADGQQLLKGEGVAFVAHGSRRGLSSKPDWTFRGGQMLSKYGATVRCAGDVNGDGFDDVVIGQSRFSGEVPRQGRIWVHYGSPRGLLGSSDWPSGMHPGWRAYTTWLALGALALSISALFISRYRYRQREAAAVAASAIRERAQIEERQRISQDLHDQLGAELTGIAIASANARNQSASGLPSEAKFNQIESTATRLVENLAEIVWVTKPSNDSLEATATFLADLAASQSEKAGLRCTLSIPTDIPPRTLDYRLRHDLVLVVKEAIHNAIKHSGGGRITLTVRVESEGKTESESKAGAEAERLMVAIRDDGSWREPKPTKPPGHGNGLDNMRDRIRRHDGVLRVAPSPEGTTVSIELPLPSGSGRTRPGQKRPSLSLSSSSSSPP